MAKTVIIRGILRPRHVLPAVLALLLAAQAGAAGLEPDPAEGSRLARQWCSQCHLVDPDGPVGPDAGPPFAALANDPAKSAEEIRGFLHHPEPPMPPLQLTEREIDHLVAYIESLAAPADGDAAAGRAFAAKNCAGCHATGRLGESRLPAAPPFRDLAAKWNPEVLAEALAEGIVVGHPAMPEFRLEETEIADLLAYLRSLRGD